jgi:hypothetical protein
VRSINFSTTDMCSNITYITRILKERIAGTLGGHENDNYDVAAAAAVVM